MKLKSSIYKIKNQMLQFNFKKFKNKCDEKMREWIVIVDNMFFPSENTKLHLNLPILYFLKCFYKTCKQQINVIFF